jgi:catechol 2,3-dioxygenase-like lactoylglutathione lyase family enzyme
MDHIVINADDEEKLVWFYSEVLQLDTDRLEAYRAGEVPFPSVRLNADTIIDLFPKKLWHKGGEVVRGLHNMNHLCLALRRGDWERLSGRLEARQIEIEDGPGPRWGAHGTGTSIYFRDPEGNLVEARYYE